MIFQAQRFVPSAIEIGIFAAVIKIVMRAVAFFAGVEFLQEIRLGGIGDVIVADAAQTFDRPEFCLSIPCHIGRAEIEASRTSAAARRCTS